MFRRVVNLSALLLLALSAALAVLWVRSAFVRDTIRVGPGARVTIVESSGGELAYLRGTYQSDGKFLLVRKAVRVSHLTPAALLALPPLAWLLWVLVESDC